MSQFFITCKESRIENNRSFYGCFYLGPFEPSQSVTIANTLRRTLLSEIYGLGIISVEIDGVSHEYSSLPGVRDSVLDILLNLKEIVLKKTMKNFKPQIAYLRVRGPGVVRASHLRFPPFIQCVDPDQYIATLAENGFLNLKCVIQYGNKWVDSESGQSFETNQLIKNSINSPKINPPSAVGESVPKGTAGAAPAVHLLGEGEGLGVRSFLGETGGVEQNNPFNNHLKKRRLILKKLEKILLYKKHKYLKIFSDSHLVLSDFSKKRQLLRQKSVFKNLLIKKYPAINFKLGLPVLKKGNRRQKSDSITLNKQSPFKVLSLMGKELSKNSPKKKIFLNSKPLIIDAIFNPINKVNYIIQTNDFKEAPSKLQASLETSELYEMLDAASNSFSTGNKVNTPFQLNRPKTDFKTWIQNEESNDQLINKGSLSVDAPFEKYSKQIIQSEIETILDLKREINNLKKESIKHNITLEVWTNGSIHPRDALYQSFKNLIKVFGQLEKLNPFGRGSKNFTADSLSTIQTKLNNISNSDFEQNLAKKNKMKTLNFSLFNDLIPLDSTVFLNTYMDPNIKNYYFKNQSFNQIFKNLKNHEIDHLSGLKLDSPLTPSVKGRDRQKLQNSVSAVGDPLPLQLGVGTDETIFYQSNNSNFKADIGILNLSLRCYTGLKRLKINTIENLIQLSKQDLINKGENNNYKLNKLTLDEIEKSLNQFGLNFKAD